MNWAIDIIAGIQPTTLLCFYRYKFCDPSLFLKDNNIIFPGSFNPVHNAHLVIGNKAIFELCISNFYKGDASPYDIYHRINMLSSCGIPVLLTKAKTYTEKNTVLKQCVDQSYTYRIGGDAWNRCSKDAHMFYGLDDAKIEVYPYQDEPVNNLDFVNYSIVHKPKPIVRSSDIRNQLTKDFLPQSVISYIQKNNLYK